MHPDRLAVLKSGLERFHEFAHTESLVAKCLLCRFCFFGFGLTAILSFLFGDERLTALQWTGMAVAMIGIYLTQHLSEKKSA